MRESNIESPSSGARMMRPICLAAVFAAMLPLAACDTTNYAAKKESQTPMAPDAPTRIVTGAQMNLRVPLELPTSGAPLLFQGNAIATQAELARNAPFCRLAGASPSAPRALKPTNFTVRSIDYDDRRAPGGPRPVAVTHFTLVADPTQQAYVLSCQWPEGAPAFAFVTTDEVQATISAYFTLDASR